MTRTRAPGDGDPGVWQCRETDVMDGGVLQPDQHSHQSDHFLQDIQLLPGPLDDVSLDGGLWLESVQLLPVAGELGVPSGGDRIRREADQGEDHSQQVRS